MQFAILQSNDESLPRQKKFLGYRLVNWKELGKFARKI